MSWSYGLDAYMQFLSFFEAHVRFLAESHPFHPKHRSVSLSTMATK